MVYIRVGVLCFSLIWIFLYLKKSLYTLNLNINLSCNNDIRPKTSSIYYQILTIKDKKEQIQTRDFHFERKRKFPFDSLQSNIRFIPVTRENFMIIQYNMKSVVLYRSSKLISKHVKTLTFDKLLNIGLNGDVLFILLHRQGNNYMRSIDISSKNPFDLRKEKLFRLTIDSRNFEFVKSSNEYNILVDEKSFFLYLRNEMIKFDISDFDRDCIYFKVSEFDLLSRKSGNIILAIIYICGTNDHIIVKYSNYYLSGSNKKNKQIFKWVKKYKQEGEDTVNFILNGISNLKDPNEIKLRKYGDKIFIYLYNYYLILHEFDSEKSENNRYFVYHFEIKKYKKNTTFQMHFLKHNQIIIANKKNIHIIEIKEINKEIILITNRFKIILDKILIRNMNNRLYIFNYNTIENKYSVLDLTKISEETTVRNMEKVKEVFVLYLNCVFILIMILLLISLWDF